MKKLKIVGLLLLFVLVISCSKGTEVVHREFEFIDEYSTTITVGGFVGITERVFKIGEVYEGTDTGGETITIRIAEHTELNEDCPNSWCYQEMLDVPRELLRLVK